MTVGEKIKELRLRAGLSQAQPAKELCVSRAAIAKWKNDNGLPDIANLKTPTAYLRIDLDDLLDESKGIPEEMVPVRREIPESVCGQCEYQLMLLYRTAELFRGYRTKE